MVLIRHLLYEISKWSSRGRSLKLTSRINLIGNVFTISFSSVRHLKPNMCDQTESVKRTNEIITSPEDKRQYRGLELDNKIKILLISDPDTDKAAAAIQVNVGYFNDPEELPGLAHFCEHMLFMGTLKYPAENDYTQFIKKNGGSSNASTASSYTNFYFDVLPEHLQGALDRFAQFFLTPLFTASATEREIIAVNSEFEKNYPNDIWRYHYVDKYLSKNGHPYKKFGSGNLKTLSTIPKEKKIDLREELLKFHQKWYSSNVMTLAVLGKESLDELENTVTSLFSNVENKSVDVSDVKESPFGPEQLQIKTYLVPVKDIRNITITFPVPNCREHYKTAPYYYLSHLIGHEGSGSLLSALKAKGWCNYLECYYWEETKGFAFFNIKIDLTENGLNHTDDITTLIFQYINMLKKEKPQEWIFEEVKQIQKVKFRFKEKEIPMGYVTSLARRLQEYPIEEVLSGPYLLEEWKPELIDLCLNYLQPRYARIIVTSQSFQNITNETEPWFGAKYKIEKIPPSLIQKWENCGLNKEFKLPKPNSFITTNYDILPLDDKANTPHPIIIHDSPISRIWFKQDDEFLLPKAFLKFEFINPLAVLDPLNTGLTHLFVQTLKDSLTEFNYDAKLAGLDWNITSTDCGMLLSVSGYNEKLGLFLDSILEKITTFKVDPQRFEFIKELYVRTLKNFQAEQPYHQVMYYLSLLMTEHAWTKNELLDSVDYLTVDKLQEFIPQLLSKFHIEGLIHGNVNREGAQKIIDILDKRLTSKTGVIPILPKQMLKVREVQLEDGAHFMYETPNEFFSSSCAEAYYQCGVLSTQNNMLMELLIQLIHDPFFNTLRTKEQLGYVVTSGLKRSNCVQGLCVMVQSDRHPLYVDQRIEAFLIQFRELLEEMSDEEFDGHRESLATLRLEKPRKLSLLSARFWSEISSQQYHFNRAEVEVAYLRTITKDQLLEFFDEYIKYGACHRRKLSVYIMAKGEGGAGNQAAPDAEFLSRAADGLIPPPPYSPALKIEDVTKFKSSHGLYPLVQPYMNIKSFTTKSKL